VQRGTAVVPTVSAVQAGFPNVVQGIGGNRTPMTTTWIWASITRSSWVKNVNCVSRETGFNVFNSQRAVTWIRPSQLTVELEVVRVLFRRYQSLLGVRHC